MMPDSSPCSSRSLSARCSEIAIRRVTQKASTGPRNTANRRNQVTLFSETPKWVATRSLPPPIHSRP